MADGLVGYDITVELHDGSTTPGSYDELAYIRDVTPPDETVDLIDATHMKSPGRRKEYLGGLIEGGEGGFDLIWVPGNPTEELIRAWRTSAENRNIRITYPNGERETWEATYRGFSRTASIGQLLTGKLTVKQAGDPVYDTVTP